MNDSRGVSAYRPFRAAWGLTNGHAMTIFGNLRPRDFGALEGLGAPVRREFTTEPGIRVVGIAHRHADAPRPLVMIVHGLEGSADSGYVKGTAIKAFRAGFDVLRYNVRGCGGTSALSPRLYHSGLTSDLRAVVRELIEVDGVESLYLVGFSMGGNQSLKLAGEFGAAAPRQLRGVCAISPPIDLASCSRSIGEPANRIYEARFVRSLARTMREKERLFPGQYDLSGLDRIRHLWDWDDYFQPYNGFRDAADYYAQASSIGYLPSIGVPTLIIHAQDDPFIPFGPFEPLRDPQRRPSPAIDFLAPRHGGHVGFCGVRQPDEDRAWAENRAIEFFRQLNTGMGAI